MKKYGELTRLLDFMEQNIDLDHIREVEQLHYGAIKYSPISRLPLTVCAEAEDFKKTAFPEAFENPEKMLFNELLWSSVYSPYSSVCIGDDSPLMIRSNHGPGIIASMFGCKSCISEEGVAGIEKLTLDEARKAISKGIPNIKSALGKAALDTYMHYHERLKSFPKCYEAIRITQPDMQGPFDILYTIIGDEAYRLLQADPKMARESMDIIAQTYVIFRKELEPLLTDQIYDAVFINGMCCGGRVMIRSDKAAGLSEELYSQYEGKAESYILESFEPQGGGSICYKGEYMPTDAVYDKNLRSVSFETPEKQNLSANYSYFKNKGISITGWGRNQDYDSVKRSIQSADEGSPIITGLTLMCRADNISDGIEIMKKHRN